MKILWILILMTSLTSCEMGVDLDLKNNQTSVDSFSGKYSYITISSYTSFDFKANGQVIYTYIQDNGGNYAWFQEEGAYTKDGDNIHIPGLTKTKMDADAGYICGSAGLVTNLDFELQNDEQELYFPLGMLTLDIEVPPTNLAPDISGDPNICP